MLAALAASGHAHAQADPWAACTEAAAAAEAEAGIPPGLLLAIGKVESGRVNPSTGRVVPWPFALNIAGRGAYPLTAEAAMAEVRMAQAEGVRSIDVGCFQVNLLHHPNAFPSLADGFDPARNAAYAAGFLASLRAKLATWELAAGGYHSLTPMFGEPYAARVMATWSGQGPLPPLAAGSSTAARAYVSVVSVRPMPAPSVRVYAPGDGAGGWSGAAYMARTRLPVLYVPSQK